jgi:hypothetical protein
MPQAARAGQIGLPFPVRLGSLTSAGTAVALTGQLSSFGSAGAFDNNVEDVG